MRFWNLKPKNFQLLIKALVCLTLAGNSYAVDWQDPCSEETRAFCEGREDREVCLIEHREEITGVCLERMLDFLQRHPELEKTSENPSPYYFNNGDTKPKSVPAAAPEAPKIEIPTFDCSGMNSLNSECYSRPWAE